MYTVKPCGQENSKCKFCNKVVPLNRRGRNGKPPKYCSKQCVKKAFYVKEFGDSKLSIYNGGGKEFDMTATGKGMKWEIWFCDTFGAKWMNADSMNKPYDAKWKGKNIDVKSSEWFTKGRSNFWNFKPNSFIKPEIDFFACVCLLSDIPQKVLLVPSSIYYLNKGGISVGKNSKFDNFSIYNILKI